MADIPCVIDLDLIKVDDKLEIMTSDQDQVLNDHTAIIPNCMCKQISQEPIHVPRDPRLLHYTNQPSSSPIPSWPSPVSQTGRDLTMSDKSEMDAKLQDLLEDRRTDLVILDQI